MEKCSARRKKGRVGKVTLMTGIFSLDVNQPPPLGISGFSLGRSSSAELSDGVAPGACGAPGPAGRLSAAAGPPQAAPSAAAVCGGGTGVMG